MPVRKYAFSACLSLYMRAGMEEAEAVDTLVQRLKSDGYQVLQKFEIWRIPGASKIEI